MKRTIVTILVVGAAHSAHAAEVSESERRAVEKKFPGAVINETELETSQGQPVTEVELTTQDGKDYEVLLSQSGEILCAEEETGLPWIGGELALGLAVRMERELYRGVDTEIEPTLFGRYENGRLEILAYEGLDATFRLLSNERLSVSLSSSLQIEEGYDADDSAYFDGMDEIGTPYGAGIQLAAAWGNFEAKLAVEQDVSGEHDGQEAEGSLRYATVFAGFELLSELNLSWMSGDVAEYYYGVSDAESRPNRPAYSPGPSFEIGVELMVQRPLGAGFTTVGQVEVSTVGGEIKDSPLVDSDYEIEGALGVMYSF